MKRNPVVYFEIYADDPGELGKFYSSLFDWDLEPMSGMDYTIIRTAGNSGQQDMPRGGINGGMLKRPAEYEGPAWVNYVLVESLDSAIQSAQKLGAMIMKEKTPVPGMGWFAILSDPQGNPFALWQTDDKAK